MMMAKLAGGLMIGIGLSGAVIFGGMAFTDSEFAKAKLLVERNPGNVMYEAQFGGAQIKRAFQLSTAAGGVLLALNGVTMFLVGVVGSRRK